MKPEERLAQLGLKLPAPSRPAGNYVAFVEAGNLLFISAQFPIDNGVLRYVGRIGAELSEEEGYAAARLAGLNVLSQIQAALGTFERLTQLVRVEGHVASAPQFKNQPRILDGASDLFVAVLGERGHHTRAAFAPERLPLDLAVELVVTVAIRPK